MRVFPVLIFLILFSSRCLTAEENADTIYLNNGRSMSGVISAEDANTVKLDTEVGTIVIGRSEIKNIYHAPDTKISALKERWDEERSDINTRQKVSEEDRTKRLKVYADWVEATGAKTLASHEEGEIPIMNDPASKSYLADVLVNGNVKALLVIDTGASIIVLSKSVGEKLGFDMSNDKGNDIMVMHLAGGRSVNVKAVVLKSVNISGIEEKNVPAAVLLDDKGSMDFKDGLLGRSFLSRFNIKIDQKQMKMILQKLN